MAKNESMNRNFRRALGWGNKNHVRSCPKLVVGGKKKGREVGGHEIGQKKVAFLDGPCDGKLEKGGGGTEKAQRDDTCFLRRKIGGKRGHGSKTNGSGGLL